MQVTALPSRVTSPYYWTKEASKLEFERRLVETRLKIKRAQTELEILTKRREDAMVAGSRDAVDLKRQVKAAQDQLEDLTITKLALEAKIRS